MNKKTLSTILLILIISSTYTVDVSVSNQKSENSIQHVEETIIDPLILERISLSNSLSER